MLLQLIGKSVSLFTQHTQIRRVKCIPTQRNVKPITPESQYFHYGSEVPQACLRLFLSFTQSLTLPTGYNGSYIPLGRDITYTCCSTSRPETHSVLQTWLHTMLSSCSRWETHEWLGKVNKGQVQLSSSQQEKVFDSLQGLNIYISYI